MSRKKPAPPRRPVRPCTAEHLQAIREIYNDAILNSTALYEYAPRSEETMREWFAARQRDGIPVLGIEWEPGVLAGFVTWGPFRPRPASSSAAGSIWSSGSWCWRHRPALSTGDRLGPA